MILYEIDLLRMKFMNRGIFPQFLLSVKSTIEKHYWTDWYFSQEDVYSFKIIFPIDSLTPQIAWSILSAGQRKHHSFLEESILNPGVWGFAKSSQPNVNFLSKPVQYMGEQDTMNERQRKQNRPELEK